MNETCPYRLIIVRKIYLGIEKRLCPGPIFIYEEISFKTIMLTLYGRSSYRETNFFTELQNSAAFKSYHISKFVNIVGFVINGWKI